MQRQFWNREKTDKSMNTLSMLAKEVDFVLIGGWAVYLYTNAQKSQDLDLVIGYESLNYFRKFGISDYEGIKMKYSVIEGTVVDLFLEEFSDPDMPFPARFVMDNYASIGGFKVVEKELLLLLKLWGYFRSDPIKHRKDVIDVLSLLFYADIDLRRMKGIADKYAIPRRKSSDAMLEYLDKGRHLVEFVTEGEKEYERLKKRYREEIRGIFGY